MIPSRAGEGWAEQRRDLQSPVCRRQHPRFSHGRVHTVHVGQHGGGFPTAGWARLPPGPAATPLPRCFPASQAPSPFPSRWHGNGLCRPRPAQNEENQERCPGLWGERPGPGSCAGSVMPAPSTAPQGPVALGTRPYFSQVCL